MTEALRVEHITKRFPGVLANDGISLDVRQGEVHAVLGENGAGKSVLMGIISGIYQPDAGRIFAWGKELKVSSPRVATDAGIGMVHQHFMLFPPLTALQNIVVGVNPARTLLRPDHRAQRRVTDLARRYGFDVELGRPVAELSVGMQQRIEILKVLYRGARILILDEPTAVLTPQEVESLVQNLRNMVKQGLSIVFITHKLDEVTPFADRVTVLRGGRVVSTIAVAGADKPTLARLMVGRDVVFRVERPPASPAGEVLDVRELRVRGDRGELAVDDVSFTLRAGEILGVAGVDGNGQNELAEALYGLRRIQAGSIRCSGRSVTSGSTARRRRLGMRIVAANRMSMLAPSMPVFENVALEAASRREFAPRGLLRWGRILGYAQGLMRDFNVVGASPATTMEHLSGGNQQKVIMGMAISPLPQLLIVSQPTRGLDIAATEYVRRKLIECRTNGMAILLFSTDLDEVLSVSDRVGVMYRGRLQGVIASEEADRGNVGAMMAGLLGDRGTQTGGAAQ